MCSRNVVFEELYENKLRKKHSNSVSDLHSGLKFKFSDTSNKKISTNKFT